MSNGILASAVIVVAAMLCSHAHAGIEIVGVRPIHELETAQSPDTQAFDRNSNRSFDRQLIKNKLFEKYKTVENMLLYKDSLSSVELMVLRELTTEMLIQREREIARNKTSIKIEAIKNTQTSSNGVFAAINDPSVIIKRRELNVQKEEAETKSLFKNEIKIETVPYDPASSSQIQINNRVNRPSVVAFFDQLGNPYPIKSFFPQKPNSFELVRKNGNQLLVNAKDNFKEVSGFVFLDGEPQPVPFLLTSQPKAAITVKKNIILPSVSPTNALAAQEIIVPVDKINKDDDPFMYLVMHGRLKTGDTSKQLRFDGLPGNSEVYRHKNYVYIKTQQEMKYEIQNAIRMGTWYVYKAYPRSSYWFLVNNKEVEVLVYE